MSQPYYEDSHVTIYHGDCRVWLSNTPECFTGDLVLTDPPFGVGLSASRPAKMQKHAGRTYSFEDSEEYVQTVCVPVVQRCMQLFRRVVVTSGIRCAFKYPEPTTIWALYWPNGAGRGRWRAFNCWQPVLCYGDAPLRSGSIPDTFRTTEQATVNGHPCPKPLGLWRRLLSAVSVDGETVCDPFMGSGTTLRAAKDLGRKAIGIEISEAYCEIAAKRMAQGVLFDPGTPDEFDRGREAIAQRAIFEDEA